MQAFLKLAQFVTAVAVVGSNIQYHWTPNGLVAGLVAFFAALLVTVIIRDSLRVGGWLLRLLKHFNNQQIASRGIGRESASHELIGEIALDRRRHDSAPGDRLGNTEKPRIQ